METLKAMAMRKSTRAYEPEQITDEALDTVLSAGCLAPVGMGRYDSIHLTVIQKRVFLDKISEASKINAPRKDMGDPFYGAPTAIFISAKKDENMPGATTEMANAACIIENMHLAATDLGLGSVYLMGVVGMTAGNTELHREMGVPNGYTPVSALALGYPVEPLTEIRGKNTISMNIIA